jgi:hypothetical protein
MNMSRNGIRMIVACLAVLAVVAGISWANDEAPLKQKRVSFQGTSRIPDNQQSAVYVEPVMLTEVYHRMGPGLNIGAVVAREEVGKGLQKAADVWGLNLDLFVLADAAERRSMVQHLIDNFESSVIVEPLAGESWTDLQARAEKNAVPLKLLGETEKDGYAAGFAAIQGTRANLIARLPKYDEILPVAFPISPLPDTFFQPSKFPYPRPLVRVERTSEPLSASLHAHTSCNMVAQTGNMLHRTSSIDPDLFLMGMEGGNLSLKAMPGAVDPEKISAVMTSWVMAVRGKDSEARDILVENDGVGTSFFKPALHAPEELEMGLEEWKTKGIIRGFRRLNHEDVLIEGWDGADRVLRAGMFIIASNKEISKPELTAGVDARGRKTLEFLSTQRFLQQLVELPAAAKPGKTVKAAAHAKGGILTAGGATVAGTVGQPLQALLRKAGPYRKPIQPYAMSLEGGFLVVTPEVPLTTRQLATKVARVDLDLRGPLTSDQTILVTLEDGEKLTFRRTVLDFDQLDEALAQLRAQGMIADWTYDGARGRGLNANVVLQHFYGKHRKFMSSLCTWPNDEHPDRPIVRFYVDGMQRLNFSFISKEGWRQEFVEVPLQVPPVPRDVELYSGVHTIGD